MIIFGIGALTFKQSTRIKLRSTNLESSVLQKCRNRMGNLESKWLIFVVGSQLSDFIKSPKNFVDLEVTNWMHGPIVRMVSKPKIRGCLHVPIGLGELVGAQLVTLSFSP